MPLSPRFVLVSPAGLVAAGLFAGLTGCVSQQDYQALQMDRDNLAEQLAGAEADAARNRGLATSYRDQLSRTSTGRNAEDAMLANYQQQVAALQAERDQLISRYEDMLGRIGTGPALPEALTSELTTFAASNPDLVEFDATRGIVKFKSDVTFQSGAAELTAEAKSAIEKFARIVNQPVARQYELQVAGHTDNVPVSNPATRQRGHHDNWYLSSHRAIAVGQVMIGQGVDKNRLGVTGFADQRPVSSNDSAQGRQQNRRVEVLILPTTVNPTAGSSANLSTPAGGQQAEPVASGQTNPALEK